MTGMFDKKNANPEIIRNLKNKNGNTLETSIKFQKTKNRTIEHFENAN